MNRHPKQLPLYSFEWCQIIQGPLPQNSSHIASSVFLLSYTLSCSDFVEIIWYCELLKDKELKQSQTLAHYLN